MKLDGNTVLITGGSSGIGRELVKQALAGIARDRFEIRPGQTNQLRFMSRLAPDFVFGQLSKSVAKMLAR